MMFMMSIRRQVSILVELRQEEMLTFLIAVGQQLPNSL